MCSVTIVTLKFLQRHIVQHCCTVQAFTRSHLGDCVSQRFSQPSQNAGEKKKFDTRKVPGSPLIRRVVLKLFLRLCVSLLRQYSNIFMVIAFLTLVMKTGQPSSYRLKSSLVVVLEREKRCTCVCLRIADSTHTTCIGHTTLRCKDFVFLLYPSCSFVLT